MEQLLGLVSTRLRPEFPKLLERLDRGLSSAALHAVDVAIAAELLDGRQVLARGGNRLFPAFMDSLRRQADDAWSHESPAAPPDAFPDRLQPLRLLDEAIVDEDAALAGIAARHESSASLPLLLMGQRFGVLLERPPLHAPALPVGPYAFGRALREASQEIGLGLHSRLALYRLADLEFMGRYGALAEAMDAVLDAAGILRGLSYVPLRPRHVPSHPERGMPGQPSATDRNAPLSDIAALRIVNQLLDEVAPVMGALPEERGLMERREAVAALVRLVLLHGVDSPEWHGCVALVHEVTAAARERRQAAGATTARMREYARSLGYEPAEIERVVAGLATLGVDDSAGGAGMGAAPGVAAAAASARDRRWQERLEQLPPGTVIGFTATSGITRASLRGRDTEHGLLLVNEDNGHEARVDSATIARLMADGHAWVVRSRGGQA